MRVRAWLEDSAGRMYLALNQSNFTGQATEGYRELVTAGTVAMLEEERSTRAPDLDPRFGPVFNGLHFRTLTFGEYAIAEDPLGFVDTLYRCTDFTARQIAARFGEEKLPESIRDTWKEKPDQTLEVVHCSFPREDYVQGKQDRKNKPWASVYLLKRDKLLLGEGGTDEFPYIVARWTTTSGEVYGRSPAMDALPDVRSLNRARELFLRSAAKKIDPPTKSRNEGVIGDIDIRPGGNTVMENPESDLLTLDTGADIQWTQFALSELRTAIRECFFWDQLQLPGGQSPTYMTATEIERRWETMRRVLGPTLGRLKVEWLAKIIDRTFAIMLRRGAFLPMPEALRQGGEIDVEYEGPLARSQKSTRVSAFGEWMSVAAPLLEAKPEILDIYDFDKVFLDIGHAVSLPASWERDPEQVAEIRAARMQAQQTQTQVEHGTEIAAAAGKTAPLLALLQGGKPSGGATP